jgi:hypothetical protein
MRLRSTGIVTGVLATLTFAVTAANPRPAEAFFFLPMFQNQQMDGRQGRGPTDNRWRDDTARPTKPSTTTRSREDDDKPSSSSARKGTKSTTKSEAKTDSGQSRQQVRAAAAPAPPYNGRAPAAAPARVPARDRHPPAAAA